MQREDRRLGKYYMQPKVAPQPKGVQAFTIDGITVHAINLQNAARKAREIKDKQDAKK